MLMFEQSHQCMPCITCQWCCKLYRDYNAHYPFHPCHCSNNINPAHHHYHPTITITTNTMTPPSHTMSMITATATAITTTTLYISTLPVGEACVNTNTLKTIHCHHHHSHKLLCLSPPPSLLWQSMHYARIVILRARHWENWVAVGTILPGWFGFFFISESLNLYSATFQLAFSYWVYH